MRRTEVLALALVLFSVPPVLGLRTQKIGANLELVTDGFPADQAARYPLFKDRCSRCHSLDRVIDALTLGITPVTGGPFNEDDIKTYVVHMMRKRKSNISAEDAVELTKFLIYARKLARTAQVPRENGARTQTSTTGTKR